MDRVYESGAAAGAPAVPAVPSTGYPSAGNPGLGIEATKPGPWWFHMITEELRAVITAAGLVPDHQDLGQLLYALHQGFGLAKSIGSSGYMTLPGGLILQWGAKAMGSASILPITFPIQFPNSVFGVYGMADSANDIGTDGCDAGNLTIAGFSLETYTGGSPTTGRAWWFAIGN